MDCCLLVVITRTYHFGITTTSPLDPGLLRPKSNYPGDVFAEDMTRTSKEGKGSWEQTSVRQATCDRPRVADG